VIVAGAVGAAGEALDVEAVRRVWGPAGHVDIRTPARWDAEALGALG